MACGDWMGVRKKKVNRLAARQEASDTASSYSRPWGCGLAENATPIFIIVIPQCFRRQLESEAQGESIQGDVPYRNSMASRVLMPYST